MKRIQKKTDKERRRYPRYNTEMDVYFKIKYDTKMRVEFQVIENHYEGNITRKYFGLCRNVGAEGLYIESKKELKAGDNLMLEVYEPIIRKPIKMEGQVRWCVKCSNLDAKQDMFGAGVQITAVGGKAVSDSVYYDKKYAVVWSALLDSLFGTFAGVKKYPDSSKRHKC